MTNMTCVELKKLYGGSSRNKKSHLFQIVVILFAGIAFFSGVISGYMNPEKCR